MAKRPTKLNLIKELLPVKYRYNRLAMTVTLGLSFVIIIYCLYFIARFVSTDTPTFYKILPFIICFIALDSILRKVTTINSITFDNDSIKIAYIAKKSKLIPYDAITRMELDKRLHLMIDYQDEQGKECQLRLLPSFPLFMEIILNLSEFATKAEKPEKFKGVIEYLKTRTELDV